MKNVIITIISIILSINNSFSQDTIFFRDATKKGCQIISHTDSEVIYKTGIDNTIAVSADKIFMIKKQSGEIKIYNITEPKVEYTVRKGQAAMIGVNLMFRKNTPVGIFLPVFIDYFPFSFNISVNIWKPTFVNDNYNDLITQDHIAWGDEYDLWRSISIGLNKKLFPFTLLYCNFGYGWIDKYQYATAYNNEPDLVRLSEIKRIKGFQLDPGIAFMIPIIKTKFARLGLSANIGFSSLNFDHWKYVYGLGLALSYNKFK